ncbi:PACE efflux transporter [Achromobacter sp. F4_2707]|uniref:PACE efflux transporter n=1 Tax=Achromobacter sp. F4_2707 TaxID=3114286 RepID=UPI0039C63C10
MQGWKRRVVYVTLYEGIAIVLTGAVLFLLGHGLTHSLVASVGASVLAVLWNLIFNAMFEAWERRQTVKGRSIARRIAHAIGFEGGLVLSIVPFFAWWLEVSLWQAFVMDLGFIVFFLVYTFVFAWCFDKVFGLPASAMPAPVTPQGTPAPVCSVGP